MNRRLLIVLFAVMMAGMMIFASAIENAYEGRLLQIKGVWFLKTAETVYALDIEKIESSNPDKINLEKGDIITVTGDEEFDVITVETLKTDDAVFNATNTPAKDDYTGYKVDAQRCISCQLCVKNCPVGAISMVNGKAVIDVDKCIQCGICKNGNGQGWKGCPVGAIDNK